MEPVFNHTMVYDGFRQEDLKEACVELTVWDRDKLASNFLGGLRLGPGTGTNGLFYFMILYYILDFSTETQVHSFYSIDFIG